MIGQFKHFTENINLVPMGGSTSISFKWELAKRMEEKWLQYEKPITILYFGDEDLAGHEIERTISRDVRHWSKAEFNIVRCGLTEDQIAKYGVPISYEGKGYQWEALEDAQAKEIIKESISKYINLRLVHDVKIESYELRERIDEAIDEMVEDL